MPFRVWAAESAPPLKPFPLSYFGEDERAQKQRQVNDRSEKEPAGVGPLLVFQKSHRNENEEAVQEKLRRQIIVIHDFEKRGRAGNEKKEDAEEHALACTPGAAVVALRNHLETGPRVIFAIHPRDGEKVRHLPEEEDRKQTPGADLDMPGRG